MKFLDRDSYLIDFIGIYFLIICAFFTILRDMDIYYMYLILVIINGVVALFAYIISVVTLSTAQEKIYKDLARIFGIVAVLKILFAIYLFDNLGSRQYCIHHLYMYMSIKRKTIYLIMLYI